MKAPACHLVIPDLQITPESNTANVEWFGKYAYDLFTKRPERCVIVSIGDWHDMKSLSSYDKPGSKNAEGQRIQADLDCGNDAIDRLSDYLDKADKVRAEKGWSKIQRHFCFGNHEDRLFRLVRDDVRFEGVFGEHSFRWKKRGWKTHSFLEVTFIDGIAYSHYFYNPMTGRPYSGNNIELRLKTIGCSFTMGHQQIHLTGIRQTISGIQRGLVSGRAYLDSEDYIGPQGNGEWAGIIVKNEVRDGNYDIMEVSLGYLCAKYTGKSLAEFLKESK